jgi:hypothetical protein
LLPALGTALFYGLCLKKGWGSSAQVGFSWKRYLKYAFSPVG